MTAANHRREPMFPGFGSNDWKQSFHVFKKDVGRLHHLNRKRGIDHIAAGQPEMEPAAGGRADVFGDVGGKGDDIVVKSAFKLLATVETEFGPSFYLRQIFFRDYALRAKRFTGEQFNLQPDLEFALFAPDFPHDRAGV